MRKMMTVRLIAHTPEPEKVVAAAAKLCYSDAHITDLLDGLDPLQQVIRRCIKKGASLPDAPEPATRVVFRKI